MASVTPQISNLPLEDTSAARPSQRPTLGLSTIEAKVESVVGINIAALQQGLANDSSEDEHISFDRPISSQPGLGDRPLVVPNPVSGNGSPQKVGAAFQGQGQHFEPLDKSVSQTVKLNPKMELSKTDLLKLLSCMEAELQARDVVIATLKTERIKNLLHYGRVGLNDPFLALQRDSIGGQVFGGGGVTEGELRSIEETQLQQLENLITQQRKAHQRMRQVLREAEKRHSWTVDELEKERKKHENDIPQEEFPNNLENDKSKLKQSQELDSERAGKRKMEKEIKKLQETLEEERGKQKEIILMLVEERKRLALQYVEERKRSEDLAQILSEEKGRIDSMAEGLEEESKKSLQMEAELEKQLAEFDTEKQQMGAQIARKDERINELEAFAEKLQREVEHYKKQLQEAHNVAMFQQTLSVSPPRIGIGTSPQRPQPPQLPVKPPSLAQGQSRLQAAPAHSNVTKAVQLTATVNSVPVAGPTTGIARGVQPGIGVRTSTLYSASASEVSRPITSTAKTYSESESAWVPGSVIECDASSSSSSSLAPQGPERSLSRGTGGPPTPQVVQVSPRVNVSASSSNKVITTSHGGKVTFHVTTNAPSGAGTSPGASSDQTVLKKPAPPTRSSQPGGVPPPLPLNKPLGAPPVPPNKPVLPPKKMVDPPPISVEVKPQKVGPQTVKFGITISKATAQAQPPSSGAPGPGDASSTSGVAVTAAVSPVAPGVEGVMATRRENSQVEEGARCEMHECVDSLCHELENFHQLLSSMADHSDLVENPTPVPHHFAPSGPTLYSSCDSVAVSPFVVDEAAVIKNSDCRESLNKSLQSIAVSSSQISTSVSCCQPSQHVGSDVEMWSSLPSCSSQTIFSSSSLQLVTTSSSSSSSLSSSSSSSSHSSLEKDVAPYFLSHLPVTSFPSVSECEESASTQACKGPPMSIPHHTTSPPMPSPPSLSLLSSSPSTSSSSSSATPPRPRFLPVDSTLETHPEDLAPPPHSPIDVATPLTADGMTALHIAAQGNNWQSVAMLVRCGSSVNAEDDEGRTPLYLALLYACIPAAKALMTFPQSMEHTTLAGCNLLHAAAKSGEVDCISLITQHIFEDPEGGFPLLHLLATSPDHHGHTPVALALAATSPQMAQVLLRAGIDLKALVMHCPQLLHLSSSASLAEFCTKEFEEIHCPVWVKGISLGSENEEKWAVGTVLICPSTLWNALERDITTILTKHLEAINRCGRDGVISENCDLSGCADEDSEMEEGLGLTEESVECFSISGHYWKKGDPKNPELPYELLKKAEENSSYEGNEVVVHFCSLPAVAYTCLTPVFLLENYLRLLDQSKCVVVYGAESSGKRVLARCLASLWSCSFAEDALLHIDLFDSSSHALLAPSVEDALCNGRILVLERLPRDSWALLWGALKRGSAKRGGRVIATMDSWRRPSGQLESDVLWVQLRHDRQPLRDYLARFLNRQIGSVSAGVPPPARSQCAQMINWVRDSQARLSDTLMSLGFSPVLRGPRLLARALKEALNAKDIVRAVERTWNDVMVPAIIQEVRSVWKMSPLYGGDRAPNESRVAAMALHVIFQRSFLSGWPQPPNALLVRFEGRSPPHSKDLALNNSPSKPSPPPLSPEWNEDNLAKILGLPPVGYA